MPADRKEYMRQYHLAHREERNAKARARNKANPEDNRRRQRRHRNLLKEREANRKYNRDHADRRRAYHEANKERIATARHAYYLRTKKERAKPDPIGSAQRLLKKAEQAARLGYTGKLCPDGFDAGRKAPRGKG